MIELMALFLYTEETNMEKQVYNDVLTTKVTVAGKEYTLQRIPLKFYLDINDRNKNKFGVLQQSSFAEDLLKHCVISPKVSLKDFEYDYTAGMDLVSEIETFLTTKADKTTSKSESQGQ